MIAPVLLGLPLLAGCVVLFLPNGMALRRRILAPATGAAHLLLTGWIALHGDATVKPFAGWLGIDPLGQVFLWVTGILFLAATIPLPAGPEASLLFPPDGRDKERVHIAGLLFSFAALSAICCAQNLVVLWLAIAANVFAARFLSHRRAFQETNATGSRSFVIVLAGLAVALAGIIMLWSASDAPFFIAGSFRGGLDTNAAFQGDHVLLKAAFIFLFAGFATRMALAPLHAWLPREMEETPPSAGALLSGPTLATAFLALLRIRGMAGLADLTGFLDEPLRLAGLLSMAVAAFCLPARKDVKRLLAYAAVGQAGILAFAAGLGGNALWAALLHALCLAFVTGSLVLGSGNMERRYGMSARSALTGLRNAMPITGALWLAGLFALGGLPPFGLFFSEFTIARSAFAAGRFSEAILFLVFLAALFLGQAKTGLSILRGGQIPEAQSDDEDDHAVSTERVYLILPPLVLLALALFLGFGIPEHLGTLLNEATAVAEPGFLFPPGMKP